MASGIQSPVGSFILPITSCMVPEWTIPFIVGGFKAAVMPDPERVLALLVLRAAAMKG